MFSIITDGKKLRGQAMPGLLKQAQEALVGRTIKRVGYLQYEEGEPQVWPVLVLDDKSIVVAQCDDEGNGPGVLRVATDKADVMICQTEALE